MREFLAKKLLVKIMDWTPEKISIEIPLLQALANFKYNEYQQFSAGMRFIESLAKWLKQFDTNERRTAYDFIKENLIFISNVQMQYLVSITFNEKINPVLINKTASQKDMSVNSITKIVNSNEYKSNLRKSLFIGLSDGSRIDYLRRSNNINNEQIALTHEISQEKVNDMIEKLHSEENENSKFDTVFLIDDFTASGISYFRPNEKTGKIWKFLDKVFGNDADWNMLTNKDNLEINIIFYIANEDAIEYIKNEINNWKYSSDIQNKINVDAIQFIRKDVKQKVLENNDFINLLIKYFDPKIITKHFYEAKHDSPYLGFNECALPIVLNHNTPNNSLPIIWYSDEFDYSGLFPRITRHK